MKVLVTGVRGQLGHDVMKELAARNMTAVGTDINDFDITDFQATETFITHVHPDVVVHCSAYTAVDKAEDNSDVCIAVNVTGTKNIALVCKDIGAALVYISTDYVFSGIGEIPYEVTDIPDPLSVYGKSKMEGEKTVKELMSRFFIIRTAWAFGANGNNFVKTMLRLGRERDTVSVVSDQCGSPTYTPDLARLICDMIETDKYGIYHATNEGFCTWAEFAAEIFRQAEYPTHVNFITTAEYPTKAVRPANSRLSKKALDEAGFKRLPDWKDALTRYLKELKSLDAV